MKKLINNFKYLVILSMAFMACEPQQDSAIDLGAPPASASFTIEETNEPNTYRLTNTTDATFIHQWDLGNGATAEGDVVEVFYPEMGDYVVTLRAFNKAGFASGMQNINVPEDAPVFCEGNEIMEFLTDCDSKTWKLIPDEGALLVGPDDGSGSVWWQNPPEEVDARPCLFDDEWIFTFDGLQMQYDTKGQVWAEDYMGFNFECVGTDQLVGAVQAWGDGNHTFLVDGSTNPATLSVVGLGAFMGIPKAANGAEVNSPQQSIIYDIVSMETVGNNDILTIQVGYVTGDGQDALWRFTFVSN